MSEKTANPAPLGLLGFGITTVLAQFVHNVRLGSVDSMVLGMALAYGGLAQVIAGIMEYKRGDTFGTVAFTSYGLFWWSYAFINMLPNNTFTASFYGLASSESLAAYFFMWGLFTLSMFFGALKKNRALQFVFMSLAILFFLLAARDALVTSQVIAKSDANWNLFTQITGAEGIICGLSAFYLAIAEILNETHEKTVLPIGQVS
jgi:succinate-acetate transporter protein